MRRTSLLLLLIITFILTVVDPSHAQSAEPIYTAHEIWHYGNGVINSIEAFSPCPNGKQVAVYFHDSKELDVLNTSDGQLDERLSMPYGLDSPQLKWNRTGNMLAISSRGLDVWKFSSGEIPSRSTLDYLSDITWASNDILVGTHGIDHLLHFIDVRSGKELMTVKTISENYDLQSSPDGKFVALLSYNPPIDDNTYFLPELQLKILNRSTLKVITPYLTDENGYPIDNFHFSVWLPDSSGIIGTSDAGALWRWNMATQTAKVLVAAPVLVPNIMIAPYDLQISINTNGTLLAMTNASRSQAGSSDQIDVIDLHTGSPILSLSSTLSSFAWSDNNTLIINNGDLEAWQITPTS